MTRKTIARSIIAAAALTGLGLVAAAPASAHTNNLYTYFDYVVSTEAAAFGTMNKADGVGAALAPIDQFEMQGIEVLAEQGYALFYNESVVISGWNHTTGELGVPIAMYIPEFLELEFDLDQAWGLDARPDGTLLTTVEYDYDDNPNTYAVASVDPGTGIVTPLVDITDAISVEGEVDYSIGDLATDPATGITYVFVYGAGGEPFYLAVDTTAVTVGEPTLLQGTGFESGSINGADFDADGTLYFIYANNLVERYQLAKLGAQSGWVTASLSVISDAPAQYDDFGLSELALATESVALANTGSELPIAAIVLVGTVAVLAGGVTVMVARRRSERGTV